MVLSGPPPGSGQPPQAPQAGPEPAQPAPGAHRPGTQLGPMAAPPDQGDYEALMAHPLNDPSLEGVDADMEGEELDPFGRGLDDSDGEEELNRLRAQQLARERAALAGAGAHETPTQPPLAPDAV